MNDLKDTIQVGIANGSAIGFSITDCNEVLTLVSLVLAIAFTIYKFVKFDKNQKMAIKFAISAFKSTRKKRKGIHSKNASKGQNAFKKHYRGQGR